MDKLTVIDKKAKVYAEQKVPKKESTYPSG